MSGRREIKAEVADHCREIDRCNQRGGRMLSILDLLDAGTLDAETAALALALIRSGGSFLVGAVPGGAGKTTVMGALLNFVPPEIRIEPADSLPRIRAGLARSEPRCYICHEIGPGPYYAYLWDDALRAYFELPEAGHMLASNLHADTFDQAKNQICGHNHVPEAAFNKLRLLLFLEILSGFHPKRCVSELWSGDGRHGQARVYNRGTWELPPEEWVDPKAYAQAREILGKLVHSGARTIEQVRAFLLACPEFLEFPVDRPALVD